LRCGKDGPSCDGPATALHVIGFGIDDPNTVELLDEISVEGSTQRARFAADGAELRSELMALFDTIEP
jgi:hypothetical protein